MKLLRCVLPVPLLSAVLLGSPAPVEPPDPAYEGAGWPSAAPGRFRNVSTRGFVGSGDSVMIVGVVVTDANTLVLARGIGPTLASFGVTNVLTRPQIDLLDSKNVVVATNAGWKTLSLQEQVNAKFAAQLTGGFPLQQDSDDAVIIATLPPGNYTLVVKGVGNATGNALAEVYRIPVENVFKPQP